MSPISAETRDVILGKARTHFNWQDKPVPEALLREVYDLARMGATSANCCPARFVFVTTEAGKARLKPHLIPGNVDKTMSAPVTAIIAWDSKFYERVPELYPHQPEARDWFTGSEQSIYDNAMRNGTLQGAYLMLAARAFGLDCGPMSGFDPEGVNGEFFPDGRFRANFLCNVGYGVDASLHPRLPRLDFDDACAMA